MDSTYDNTKGKEFWAAQTQNTASYKPKFKFKVTFPPGDEVKLMNFAEVSAPAGVSIVIKLPFPMSEAGLAKIGESIKKAGGTVEMIN